MTVDVYVFLNDDASSFRSYQDDDHLTFAYRYTSELPNDWNEEGLKPVAEEAFDIGNGADERSEAYYAPGNRSLSVGDVVRIGGIWFACESRGWKRVQIRPISQLTVRGLENEIGMLGSLARMRGRFAA